MTTAPATAALAAGRGKRMARACVPALLIAAVLLTALPSLFHAPTASAQETPAAVWETELTVWAPSPTVTWPPAVGWTSNFAGSDWLGTVSSRTFTFEDNDYEVVQLLVDRDTSTLSWSSKRPRMARRRTGTCCGSALSRGLPSIPTTWPTPPRPQIDHPETRFVYPSGLVRRHRHRSRLGEAETRSR